MKQKMTLSAILLCLTLLLCGCEKTLTMSYTYEVDTGDAVKLTMDITDDYGITSDLPFALTCGEETLSQGTFITAQGWEEYKELVTETEDEDVTVLDSGEKDGNEYVFWSYQEEEYNYAILVGGSNTGLLLGNDVSEESARECFERLTISLAE